MPKDGWERDVDGCYFQGNYRILKNFGVWEIRQLVGSDWEYRTWRSTLWEAKQIVKEISGPRAQHA